MISVTTISVMRPWWVRTVIRQHRPPARVVITHGCCRVHHYC